MATAKAKPARRSARPCARQAPGCACGSCNFSKTATRPITRNPRAAAFSAKFLPIRPRPTTPTVCSENRRIGIDCRVPDRPFALGERIEGRVQAELTASYNRLLRETAEAASADLVVLDEGLDALALNLMDGDVLAQMLDRPNAPEVILTGHTAVPDWMNRADYLTQMRAERHPYVRGISARKGIEW